MKTIELSNKPVGTELMEVIRQAQVEQNSVLNGCNVHYLFRNHWVDTQSGEHGIRSLITRILANNPRGLTTRQIVVEVRKVNGYDRYPNKTVEQYLSVFMRVTVVGIPMRTGRPGRPTNRWYLRTNKA